MQCVGSIDTNNTPCQYHMWAANKYEERSQRIRQRSFDRLCTGHKKREILEMLNDPDPLVRAGSARILLSHSFVANPASWQEHLTYVSQLLNDSECRVRRTAIDEITYVVRDAGWQRKHPADILNVANEVSRLLADPNPLVREHSVKLLDILGDAGLHHAEKVAHLLQDPNSGVREAAANMLRAPYASTMPEDRKRTQLADTMSRHRCKYCQAIQNALNKWLKVGSALSYYSYKQNAFHKVSVQQIDETGVKVVFNTDSECYKQIPFLRVPEHLVYEECSDWWFRAIGATPAKSKEHPTCPTQLASQHGDRRPHALQQLEKEKDKEKQKAIIHVDVC